LLLAKPKQRVVMVIEVRFGHLFIPVQPRCVLIARAALGAEPMCVVSADPPCLRIVGTNGALEASTLLRVSDGARIRAQPIPAFVPALDARHRLPLTSK
jgi:hypothetical protein